MSLGNDFMDSQARILVYFHGHVDEGRLKEAVRLTLVACPWLAYRYVDDRHRPCWQRVEEGEWSQFLDMAVCPLTDPRFYQFINEPLLTDSAPQVRVGLFRGEDDVLCIRSNHMALDGGGAVNYLSLLASTYKELGKDTRHPSIKVTADRPGPLQVLREVGVLNAIRALPHIDLPGRPWGVPRTGDDDARGVYTVTQLSPERLNAVREYARVRKVTVNDVLLASFYRSLFEVCAPPAGARLMVEVPVNLRKYLPRSQADVPSDLSAVYLVNIERVENETYEQTLDRVHRQLSKKKSNRVELAELVLLELFMFPGPWLLKKLKEIVGFKAAHPVLSNLGEVNTRSADFGGPEVKDVHFIGPLLYPPNIGVGIYTFRGRLNVSLNYPCSAVDERTMERFLDLFLKEIPGPAEVPSSTELDMEGDNEKKAECTFTLEKVVCICPPPT